MAPEEEFKLTQLCQGGQCGLVIMMCHARGMCATEILILALRHCWLLRHDSKKWELGDYYVTGTIPLETNFSNQVFFWKTDDPQERIDWITEQLKQMIIKFIKERVDE